MSNNYKQYDTDTLKKLQETEIEVLSAFINICENNNLDYFMYSGSGIGVVRHQGFIPWDDDIDVGMLRKDYEKFIQIINTSNEGKYEVLTPITDKRYACSVTHFQKKNTLFVPYKSKHLKNNLGICIDIFPFDYAPIEEKKRKRQIKKSWMLGRLIYLRGYGLPIIPYKGIKKIIAQIICYMAHLFLMIFRISPKWLFTLLEKEAQKYNNNPSVDLYCFSDPLVNITYITEDELYPLQEMPFEKIMIKMPNNYHNQLKRIYGDYMTQPSIENRVNHCPYKIEF